MNAQARRIIFPLCLVIGLLLFFEIAAYAMLHLRPSFFGIASVGPGQIYRNLRGAVECTLKNDPSSLAELHPDLGWRSRPGLDNGVDIINPQGLRSNRNYESRHKPEVLRIAVFGDSFVYGSEVLTDEAWTSLLENTRVNTEVLIYGVLGYGPDQAYLRFQSEGHRLDPDITLFAVATPGLSRLLQVSSICESPSTYLVTKPRFILDENDDLVLLPNPVRRLADLQRYLDDPSKMIELGKSDYRYIPFFYEEGLMKYSCAARLLCAGWSKVWRRHLDPDRPLVGPSSRGVWNETSNAFRIMTRILDGFAATAHSRDTRPIVLILPDGYSAERARNGLPGILDPVRDYCRAQSLEFIDAMDAFLDQPASTPSDSLFIARFHYSVKGNRIVADWLNHELDRRGLVAKNKSQMTPQNAPDIN